MSKFCGKCDLYDHMMMEKTFPDSKNPNILISDELECFEIFKKRTGGILYQSRKVELTDWNIDYWIKYFNNSQKLSKEAYTLIKDDKRFKSGKKEIIKYNYIYFGRKYNSLKELNQFGFYGEFQIKFNDLLDLVPYYPYIITTMFSDQNSEKIFISKKSYVDIYADEVSNYSEPNFKIIDYYKRKLQEHYLELMEKKYV